MAKKRIHEIAKEQGITSKDLIAKLQAAGLSVKASASSVDEAEALKVIAASAAPPPEKKVETKAETKVKER